MGAAAASRAGQRGRTGTGRATDADHAAALADKIGAAGTERAKVRHAVQDLLRGREQRELAEMRIRRGIFRLADLGASQRDIAQLVGLSQPEVSRRLKRRALSQRNLPQRSQTPREVVLQRATGAIDSEQMIRTLSTMPMTSHVPRRSAAYDGAATVRGTTKELIAAFHDGLLSEAEYEAVRTAIAGRRTRR